MSGVRPARGDDAGAIAEVHVASWRGAYRGLLPQELLDSLSVERRVEQWRAQLADPEQVTLVAVDATGDVAGFTSVGASRDDDAEDSTGELYAIYLRPGTWGSGMGHALHDAAIAALGQRYREATLWVLDGNARARGFYERHGWRTDGAVKADSRGGIVLDEVRYRCTLREG